MKSHYKRIGDYVTQIKLKNIDGAISLLRGISINKYFMPSVANIIGTDLSKYRVVKKNQFAFNPMHVGRDEVLPISMLESNNPVIVSPAYIVFRVKDESELLPEYLMMWCRRSEFDRQAWFMTDNSVRGGFSWADFSDMGIPIPPIEKQHEIVREYNIVNDRIVLNEQLTKKLEDTVQVIYKQWFVDFEFPISKEYAEYVCQPELEGEPYKTSGGKFIQCEKLQKEVPVNWLTSTVGSYSKVISGYAFKSIWWTKSGSPVIKIGSFKDNTVNYSTLDYVSSDKVLSKDRFSCKPGDIVVAMTGFTMGKIGLIPPIFERFYINQRVGKFDLGKKPTERAAFLYCYLISSQFTEEIASIGGDSRQANVSSDEIEGFVLLIPNVIELDKFNSLMANSIEKMMALAHQNHHLNILGEIVLQKMSKA